MIAQDPRVKTVLQASELPAIPRGGKLYLDFEATVGENPHRKALEPYRDARILGAAWTWPSTGSAFYMPLRHLVGPNFPDLEAGLRYVRDLVTSCDVWCNHAVKYDVTLAWCELGVEPKATIDTLTRAKLLNTNRWGDNPYGLTALARDWLDLDISGHEKAIKASLGTGKGKKKVENYAYVPSDMMAQYAAMDVIVARDLDRLIERNMPADMAKVVKVEDELTLVLFDIEREGMRVDPTELLVHGVHGRDRMLQLSEEIQGLTGAIINPSSADDCFDLLCNAWGLPVLAYTDKREPSFDKDTLAQYSVFPQVASDERRMGALARMKEYRELTTYVGMFVDKYLEAHVNGVMHPKYNQLVRTGRMSCSNPNQQQLNKKAKGLVHPPPGEAFLSYDYSQVEFRLIAEYSETQAILEAYYRDPLTDFHTWVAEMCHIPRRPAKNVNFACGYGAGERKILLMLSGQPELTSEIKLIVDAMGLPPDETIAEFDRRRRARAREVYETYHRTLPGLKDWSQRSSDVCHKRRRESGGLEGYVRTILGRRRHLDKDHAHTAFNSICQGSAADINKERLIALSPRHNPTTRSYGLRICGNVHDETLLVGPREVTLDPEVRQHVARVMEDMETFRHRLTVPIVVDGGWSDRSWKDAGADDAAFEIQRPWYDNWEARYGKAG